MIPAIAAAIPSIVELAKEAIEDPDKQAELEAEGTRLQTELLTALAQQQTTPFVDGLVKFITALVALVRPLASVGVFAYGLLHPDLMQQLHQIGGIGDLAVGATFGAAPAWGVSRHREKVEQAKNSNPFLDDING